MIKLSSLLSLYLLYDEVYFNFRFLSILEVLSRKNTCRGFTYLASNAETLLSNMFTTGDISDFSYKAT